MLERLFLNSDIVVSLSRNKTFEHSHLTKQMRQLVDIELAEEEDEIEDAEEHIGSSILDFQLLSIT